MIIILYTGLTFILLSVIVNLIELKKFLKALSLLNSCSVTVRDRILYPVRLVRLFPLLTPLLPDLIAFCLAAWAGLSGGGFYTFILTMGGSCILTLGIKFFMKVFKPKGETKDFNSEYSKLKASW